MSAGTIRAMSGDRILMNYTTSLGPVDPQVFNGQRFVPALNYHDKVAELIAKSQSGSLTDEKKKIRAREIAEKLSDTAIWHSHGRAIDSHALRTELRLEIDEYSDKLGNRGAEIFRGFGHDVDTVCWNCGVSPATRIVPRRPVRAHAPAGSSRLGPGFDGQNVDRSETRHPRVSARQLIREVISQQERTSSRWSRSCYVRLLDRNAVKGAGYSLALLFRSVRIGR